MAKFLNRYRSAVMLLLAACIFSVRSMAQDLELGAQNAAEVVSPETLMPFRNLTSILFPIFIVVGLAVFAFIFFKSQKTWRSPLNLSSFPSSAKLAISLTLFSYGLVHILGLSEAYLVSTISFKTASEYFFYMKLAKLVATSHAHLFGHGTMYALTSGTFIFSRIGERWKIAIIGLALGAGLLDVPSWWAIKYGGGGYEIFSGLAGVMSVIGWGSMAAVIIYELWFSGFQKEHS